MVPKLDRELCFDCGYCDMVCPDFCFVWDLQDQRKDSSLLPKAILKGIDYQFCKSCGKCIEVCPVSALTEAAEEKVFGKPEDQSGVLKKRDGR